MKTLVTGDLHLSSNPRDAYRLQWVNHALPKLLVKHQADRLIVLGDLAEQKNNHPSVLVNAVADAFKDLGEVCAVAILKGNHDYEGNPNEAFWRFLGHIPGVTWFDEPMVVPNTNIGDLLFLPHTPDYKRDWGRIIDGFPTVNYIFTHNTFAGTDAGNGQILDGIPLAVFSDYSPVISGDVHVPQKLGPVTYVGAPYSIDFGDDYEPRILLLDRSGFESMPTEGTQKRLAEIGTADLPELLKAAPFNRGDILKVRLNIRAAEHAKLPEIREKLFAWANERGYVLNTVQIVLLDGKGATLTPQTGPIQTDEELMQSYAEDRRVGPGTLKTGLRIMEQS